MTDPLAMMDRDLDQPSYDPNTPPQDIVDQEAARYGLKKSSGRRSPQRNAQVAGAPHSYHLSGSAGDYVGTPEDMQAFTQSMAQRFPDRLSELYHGSTALKGGQPISPVAGHNDHVHVAWQSSPLDQMDQDLSSAALGRMDTELGGPPVPRSVKPRTLSIDELSTHQQFEDSKAKGDLASARQYAQVLQSKGWEVGESGGWPYVKSPRGASLPPEVQQALDAVQQATTLAGHGPVAGSALTRPPLSINQQRQAASLGARTVLSNYANAAIPGLSGLPIPEPISQGISDIATGAIGGVSSAVKGLGRLLSGDPRTGAGQALTSLGSSIGDTAGILSMAGAEPGTFRSQIPQGVGAVLPALALQSPAAIGALTGLQSYGEGQGLGRATLSGALSGFGVKLMGGAANAFDTIPDLSTAQRFALRAGANTVIPPALDLLQAKTPTRESLLHNALFGTAFAGMHGSRVPEPVSIPESTPSIKGLLGPGTRFIGGENGITDQYADLYKQAEPLSSRDGEAGAIRAPFVSDIINTLRGRPLEDLSKPSPTERWRGPEANIPLLPEGRQQIRDLAKDSEVIGSSNTEIHASNLDRTQDSARIFSKETGGTPIINVTKGLQPQSLGSLSGQPVNKETLDLYKDHILNKPDEPLPGGGESLNQFVGRTLPEINNAIERGASTGKSQVLFTHYRNVKAVEAWIEHNGGDPKDFSIDPEEFLRHDGEPGSVHRIERDENGWLSMKPVETIEPDGATYLVRHGRTAWNGPSKAEPTTPDTSARSADTLQRYQEGRLGASEPRFSPPIDWSQRLQQNVIREAGAGKGERPFSNEPWTPDPMDTIMGGIVKDLEAKSGGRMPKVDDVVEEWNRRGQPRDLSKDRPNEAGFLSTDLIKDVGKALQKAILGDTKFSGLPSALQAHLTSPESTTGSLYNDLSSFLGFSRGAQGGQLKGAMREYNAASDLAFQRASEQLGYRPDVIQQMKSTWSKLRGQAVAETATQHFNKGYTINPAKLTPEVQNLMNKGTLSPQEAYAVDFRHRIQSGQKQVVPSLQPFADTMRSLLDTARDNVIDNGRGALQSYYENYWPQLWEKPGEAGDFVRNWSSGTLEGDKGFAKAKTYPTILDGIQAGLKLKFSNPVEEVLTRVADMNRYARAGQMMSYMDDNGMLQQIEARAKIPEGYSRIDDPMMTSWAPPNRRGGISIEGYWVAPKPLADIVNNYLSPGLTNKPWFRNAQSVANAMNMADLGISSFHAMATSLNASVSKLALAVQRGFQSRDPMQFLQEAIQSPTAPFTYLWKGSQLRAEALRPGSHPDLAPYVDALVQGGARFNKDYRYGTLMSDKLMAAFRENPATAALTSSWRIPFAAIEQLGRPLMEAFVPRMKLGAAYDMAKFEMEKLGPDATPEAWRDAMGRAWDSIDNRFGQLTQDNLFWNQTAKDLAHIGTRAPGWWFGTQRELGGGIYDIGKGLTDIARLKHPDPLSPRAAYLMALPIVTGAFNAIFQATMTHHNTGQTIWPEDFRDYIAPRTGKKDEQGDWERWTPASYMKDLYEYMHAPVGTLVNKINPLVRTGWELANNRDFSNVQIRDASHSPLQQAGDVALHLGKAFIPFSIRGLQREQRGGGGPLEQTLPFFGMTRAPAMISRSPMEQFISQRTADAAPRGAMTHEEFAKAQLKNQAVRVMRLNPDSKYPKEILDAYNAGTLKDSDLDNIDTRVDQSHIQQGFTRLKLEDAIEAFRLASPQERDQTRDLLLDKANREMDQLANEGKVKDIINKLKALGISNKELAQ